MKPLYLFWDIDGTLLTTARAGIFAWEDAARDILDVDVDFAGLQTAGLTDAEIAALIGRLHGHDDAATCNALLRRYAESLPAALPRREGHVLPNVRENLEAFDRRDDLVNMLLTGNVSAGAEAKLRHYDLWRFFERTGGAFSVEGSDRPSIARRARELAAEHGGEVPPGERMVVIGDTPHDVACGKAIDARTVGVATGPLYTLHELRAAGAHVVLEQLPGPSELLELVGSTRPLGSADRRP